ncbi:MAG: type I-C CRISPR-associated endonuclease Cas1 [Clostridia bacterium]|nr:type I-C CRISPR-associated endonuclease Cas1 [Clostridia bacterium]
MKQLLNTLYVTSEDVYLTLDGENVVAKRGELIAARYPLHTLQGIITFSYAGASPALMGACAERDISMSFCTPRGRFLARISGENNGNVLLRRAQYRAADDDKASCRVASNMIFGKLYNSAHSISRTCRDHALRVDVEALKNAEEIIKGLYVRARNCHDTEELRGIEGVGASAYFGVLDHMILSRKEVFRFRIRSRRPPLDPVNALLSFAYSLLTNDCSAALESVGLDSYVGFLHKDRPGRCSLALDLMEELRPCLADRFVLTLINTRVFNAADVDYQESGAVYLSEESRKNFLKHWQERKKDVVTHPYLCEKLSWGMVPYIQALLLARYLRGDLDEYPPFLWK